ncbi:DUF4139 domain-containing protein [Antrihabitans sp. YC2-6]|uniref:DUF4139 domain-containing protein n=1 Tax=Antrihabitans sp. YC2-6 TaxID=2799498 RepID=UPI0027DB5519|nr:DUF4139 domain-containing protein [Antrihabitans sp. YC2-6]
MARSAGAYGAAPAPMMALSADAVTGEFPVVKLETATVEQGLIAATYRPVRPVAVPADGESHRATVAVLDLASELDYVTAPVIAPEAYLRATATNSSEHTLQSGRASIFHDDEYVGTTMLAVWAPGEEVELALGVDDRVRIERELVRTSAGRGFTSNKREAGYKITIANHTARDARVTVRDQLPVSRDETIAIKDPRIDPRPTEVTDLGVVTWRTTLAPGSKGEFTMGFKVEVGKGIEIANWRE